MKPLLFLQLILSLTLLLYTFNVTAQAEKSGKLGVIQSFAIHQADPQFLQKVRGRIPEDNENELAGDFKPKHFRAIRDGMDTTTRQPFYPAPNMAANCPPLIQSGFEGNPQSQYYLFPYFGPSECDIAVSNAGKIVSISNAWMRYFTENGTLVFSDSLSHFANGVLDPHVIYDPKADRFVFSCAYGFHQAEPFVLVGYGTVIGFSKSNNPANGWNLYQLPYTDFHDNTVGDYPLLAMSDNEIFITLDYYNSGNRYKHVEIIQINKAEGYAGASSLIAQNYDAPLTGKLKGTMVPAQGGSTTYGPNMYFIMANENGQTSNKYYVYEITNTISSGQAMLKRYGPVISNVYYTPQETSYQPGGIPLFNPNADNDVYVEDAFFENGILQFCQHTNVNGKAAICMGRIMGIPNNPTCSAKTISDPNLYLGFASMAYVGNSTTDNSIIMGIEHSGINFFPGLSAVYVNSNFDISALTPVKIGVDTINGVWGDFSGTCRRYNHPGEVWFEGQYGSSVFPRINWIAKLTKPTNCDDPFNAAPNLKAGENPEIYPNPASTSVFISFKLDSTQDISLNLLDANGNLIKVLTEGRLEKGIHELNWNTGETRNGIYFLQLVAGDHVVSKEISIIK
jgi:hypothetical protein